MKKCLNIASIFIWTAFAFSCSKGYDARVKNYYIEALDTVLLGDKYVFTNVARQTTSDYKHLTKGNYDVTFITRSKKRLSPVTLQIPKSGTEKITLQIDGQGTVLMLKDGK